MPTNEERLERLRTNSKRIYYQRKDAGLCVSCGEPRSDNRVRCEDCRKWCSERNKERATERRISGLCIWCGMPAGGRSLCPSCMQKAVQRNAARRAKKAEVGE